MAVKKDLLSDDEDDVRSADERATAQMRKEIEKAEREEPEPESDDEDVELELGDDDDDDDERPSRRERRGNRYREAIERAERAERAAQETQALISQMLLQQQAQRTPEADPEAELQQTIDKLYEEHEMVYEAYRAKAAAGKLTPEDELATRKKVREIEMKKLQAVAAHQNRQSGQARQLSPQQVQQQLIVAEYQDVLSDQRKYNLARAYHHQRLAEGIPDSPQLAKEAMEHARAVSNGNYRPRSAPSQAARSKLTGGGVGGGRGGTNSGETERTKIVMNKDYRKMADAMYGHIKDPVERYRKWAKGPGKAHIADMARERRG